MKYLCLMITLFLVGCSSTGGVVKPLAKYEPGKEATINIYRTNSSYHSLNPEQPHFYIDGNKMGTLGTGQAISIKVPAGAYALTVRESMLFMPTFVSDRVEIKVSEGGQYYIRYSKELSSFIPVGSILTASDKTSFSLSNRESFIQRR